MLSTMTWKEQSGTKTHAGTPNPVLWDWWQFGVREPSEKSFSIFFYFTNEERLKFVPNLRTSVVSPEKWVDAKLVTWELRPPRQQSIQGRGNSTYKGLGTKMSITSEIMRPCRTIKTKFLSLKEFTVRNIKEHVLNKLKFSSINLFADTWEDNMPHCRKRKRDNVENYKFAKAIKT